MIRLEKRRLEVDVFMFKLDQEDLHLLEVDLTHEQEDYLIRKYCHDEDGFYKNLYDSYGESEEIKLSIVHD